MAKAKEWALKVLGVFILFAFFAGWITFVGSICELRGHKKVQSWPVRRGVITQSYLRHIRGPGRGPYWHAEIAGTYVGGVERFGVRRIGYGIDQTYCSKKAAVALTLRYPVGADVDVFAAPEKPSWAILVRDNSTRPTWTALWTSLFFGLLPFFLYLGGRVCGYKGPSKI